MYFVDRDIKRVGLRLVDLTNPSNNLNFYKDAKVRKHLVLCYRLKCCYCEANIPSTAYFHVEHFYPKGASSLPAQFVGKQSLYDVVVNDIRNYHVACARCNILKSDFVGEALSPNFYHDGTQWKKTNDNYIKANIWYKGARVECSQRYVAFRDKLKMNGKTENEKIGLHSSSLLDRTLYLEETKRLLHIVFNLCIKQEYNEAKDLFNVIRNRFSKRAPYARMLVFNLGRSFIKINNHLKKH